MTRAELKKLDSLLTKYQNRVDQLYALSPAFELVVKLRAYIENDIQAAKR